MDVDIGYPCLSFDSNQTSVHPGCLTDQDKIWIKTNGLLYISSDLATGQEMCCLFFEFLNHRKYIQPDTLSKTIEFIQQYVGARFIKIVYEQLISPSAMGQVDWTKPFVPIWRNPEIVEEVVEEFFRCWRLLDFEAITDLTCLLFDKRHYGLHHVESFNALVDVYLATMIRQYKDIVQVETPWSISVAIDHLTYIMSSPISEDQRIAKLKELAHEYKFALKVNDKETSEDLYRKIDNVFRIQQRFWDVKRQHAKPRTHTFHMVGFSWGPATSWNGLDEGQPYTPVRAKLSNSAMYSSQLYLILEYSVKESNDDAPDTIIHFQRVSLPICFFPVLVQSCLCSTARMPDEVMNYLGEDPRDGICYFITRGYEKGFVSIERRMVNNPLSFKKTRKNDMVWKGELRPSREPDLEGGSSMDIYLHIGREHRQLGSVDSIMKPIMMVTLPSIMDAQPISIVFAAFGITNHTDMEEIMLQYIHDPELRIKAIECMVETWKELPHIFSPFLQTQPPIHPASKKLGIHNAVQEAAWKHLAEAARIHNWKAVDPRFLQTYNSMMEENTSEQQEEEKVLNYIAYLIDSVWYSHLSPSTYLFRDELPASTRKHIVLRERKAYLFGMHCVRNIHCELFIDKPDQDDYGGNKRFLCTARGVHKIFRKLFQQHIYNALVRELRECVKNHHILDIKSLQIDCTSMLCRQLNTPDKERVGQSGSKNTKDDQNSASRSFQIIDRTDNESARSQVRRIDTPVQRSGKNQDMRAVHGTSNEIVCIAETPDNPAGGLLKALAMLCYLTVATTDWPLIRYIHMLSSDVFTSLIDTARMNIALNWTDDNTSLLYNMKHNIKAETCPVVCNGELIGYTSDPAKFYVQVGWKVRRHVFGYQTMTIVPVLGRGPVGAPFHSHYPETRYADKNNLYGPAVYPMPIYCRMIQIFTDAGRALVPRYTVDVESQTMDMDRHILDEMKVNPMLNRQWLMSHGYIEYLSTHEQDHLTVAKLPQDIEPSSMTLRKMNRICDQSPEKCDIVSHCVVNAAAVYGIIAGYIPFADHSHAPRNQFDSSMTKQTINETSMFNQEQYANYGRLLFPQMPSVRTVGGDIMQANSMGKTKIYTFAVMSWKGMNIEDAVPISRRTIEHGDSSAVIASQYSVDLHSDQYVQQELDNSILTRDGRGSTRFNYDKIEEDGLPKIGTWLDGRGPYALDFDGNGPQIRDVVISRTSSFVDPHSAKDDVSGKDEDEDMSLLRTHKRGHVVRKTMGNGRVQKFRSVPEVIKQNDYGRVMRIVRIPLRGHKHELAKVQLIRLHALKAGDKVSLCSGHKMTISKDVPFIDLPFPINGSVIDGIIEPTFGFTRMNRNQTYESDSITATLCSGELYNMSPFSPPNRSWIDQILESNGLPPHMTWTMCDGVRGTLIKHPVMIIHCNLKVLKHWAENKASSRGQGVRSIMTGQAPGGIQRGGGIKTGEMEHEQHIGQGCGSLIHENIIANGSPNVIVYCQTCGTPVDLVDPVTQTPLCRKHGCKYLVRVPQQYGMSIFRHTMGANAMQIVLDLEIDQEPNL